MLKITNKRNNKKMEKKMKKTLISMIAGLTVVGSAFALPSPEDRKALCEKHPDKYVWVEKTQACIPINPCAPDESNWANGVREAYCLSAYPEISHIYSHLRLPKDDDSARDLIINRFINNNPVLGKNPTIKFLDDHGSGVYYVAFFTEDKNYLVTEVSDEEFSVHDLYKIVAAAVSAYGQYLFPFEARYYSSNPTDSYPNWTVDYFSYVDGTYTEKECEDMADFASLLYGKPLTHSRGKDGTCWIQTVEYDKK